MVDTLFAPKRDKFGFRSDVLQPVPGPFLTSKFIPQTDEGKHSATHHLQFQIFFSFFSADAKGQIVAQLFAVHSLLENAEIPEDSIALVYVCGEETNKIGADVSNDLRLEPEHLIVGEPTEGEGRLV